MLPPSLANSGALRAIMQAGLVKQETLQSLAPQLAKEPKRMLDHLINGQHVTPYEVAHCLSKTYGYPLIDLELFDDIDNEFFGIDRKLLSNLHIVPLNKRNAVLTVGVADPSDFQALQQIKFASQCDIDIVILEFDKTNNFFLEFDKKVVGSFEDQLQDENAEENIEIGNADVDDAPVVKYIQKLFIDAINDRASDLHFEPYEKFYRIRFRVDGQLREVAQPPVSSKEKIAARIKIISRLDISERRVPQDGRTRLILDNGKAVDFRVSTLPTLFGEKIVIRILDSSSAKVGIEMLGYEPFQKDVLMNAINRPHGMVLVTGPTGSGKTVALYSCLNILNKPGVNISTAEDPSEINLPGINQVNINDKVGLTFATALRAFLRQDPDVIMVGEIRDLETGDIAIKAAQTGHLVFSTLHTNDAAATIVRLMNMGIAPFNIASSVLLISAQRLVRKLCSCEVIHEVPREALLAAGFQETDLDGSWELYGPGGCKLCNDSGYKGRTGIYEVMPISESIQRLILTSASALDIRNQARKEGVIGLREAGLLKVKAGITSIEEVISATQS